MTKAEAAIILPQMVAADNAKGMLRDGMLVYTLASKMLTVKQVSWIVGTCDLQFSSAHHTYVGRIDHNGARYRYTIRVLAGRAVSQGPCAVEKLVG